jgi:hypothetical protein
MAFDPSLIYEGARTVRVHGRQRVRHVIITGVLSVVGAVFAASGIVDGSVGGGIIGTAALLLGARVGYLAAESYRRDWRARKQLAALPRTFIRDVAEGAVVRVVGRVRLQASTSLESPLTHTSCAYYSVRITHLSEGEEGWSDSLRFELGGDFTLVDTSGTAVVRMTDPLVLQLRREVFRVWQLRPPDVATLSGLADIHSDASYEEAILVEGQEVAVLGRATWQATNDVATAVGGGYREAPRSLVLVAPAPGPLVVVATVVPDKD